jgi:hypothetical protein
VHVAASTAEVMTLVEQLTVKADRIDAMLVPVTTSWG